MKEKLRFYIKRFILKTPFLHELWGAIARRLAIRIGNELEKHIESQNKVFVFYQFGYPIFQRFLQKVTKTEDSIILNYSSLLFYDLVQSYLEQNKSLYELQSDLLYLDTPSQRKLDIHVNQEPIQRDKPLRILYVCGMFPSIEHAGGLRLFDILEILTQKHEVDVYSCFDAELDNHSFEIVKNTFPIRALRIIHGYDIQIEDITKWIESRNAFYDVIQLEYPITITCGEVIKKYAKRVFFTHMESIAHRDYIELVRKLKVNKFITNSCKSAITHLINSCLLEKKAIELCNDTISLTEEDAKFLDVCFQYNSKIIRTGISRLLYQELEKFKNLEIIKNSVLYIGNFNHIPNLHAMEWYLKNIHLSVKAAIPDYKIFIVGAGNTTPLFKFQDESVIITGFVEHIGSYIQQTDICISPLINGAGFRGKINQYSLFNKATVATDIAIRGLPYKHYESVMVANEPKEFGEYMVQLLTDPTLKSKIADNAKKLVEKYFSWNTIINELENLYYR